LKTVKLVLGLLLITSFGVCSSPAQTYKSSMLSSWIGSGGLGSITPTTTSFVNFGFQATGGIVTTECVEHGATSSQPTETCCPPPGTQGLCQTFSIGPHVRQYPSPGDPPPTTLVYCTATFIYNYDNSTGYFYVYSGAYCDDGTADSPNG
jgi:hypothetical protein